MSEPARILIVDDDWLVGRAIQQILETAGHHVVACVASAQEALNVAVDLSLNLAVVDIRLPGDLDGVELARHLRDRHAIPIVFVTGYCDTGTLTRVGDVKPAGFVVKPFSQEQLLSVVRLALRRTEEAQTAGAAKTPAPTDVVRPETTREHHLRRISALLSEQADTAGTPPALTNREREVLRVFLGSGGVRHIADQLSISAPTVRNHLQKIYKKLGVHSQIELLRAIEGVVPVRVQPGVASDAPPSPRPGN